MMKIIPLIEGYCPGRGLRGEHGLSLYIEAVRKAFPGRPVAAVVGGFHLVDAPDDAISRVADAMTRIHPTRILCGHCTGPRGYAAMAAGLPGRVTWLACGLKVSV